LPRRRESSRGHRGTCFSRDIEICVECRNFLAIAGSDARICTPAHTTLLRTTRALHHVIAKRSSIIAVTEQ
jgi:hypothetical protein